MRLAAAIEFGTEHQQFLHLLAQNSIDPNSARQILARITKVDIERLFVEIFMDYGDLGPSSKDVRIRLFYVKSSGTFVFDSAVIR
jgi:hypothetical protein